MKITEIYINYFGKLKGLRIKPIDGVNIIYGENEAGKTTIMQFILAMFYGLGKGEQRRKYEPWSGGTISGTIKFEHEAKSYSLTRQFGSTRSADKLELWCLTTGEAVELPERTEPGTFLLEINRETFLNSVFIGQAGTPIKGENNEILARLTNLVASGDETASRTEINERLAEAGSMLRSRKANAIIPQLEKQRLELVEERAVAQKRVTEADALREDIVKLTHRKEKIDEELTSLKVKNENIADRKELARLDAIIEKKNELETAQKKYEALHNMLYSEGSGLSTDFLDHARELLDDYNRQQATINAKQEHLNSTRRKLKELDKTPLKKLATYREYSEEIGEAIEKYDELRTRKAELERELENEQPKKTEAKLPMKTIIIAALGLAVVLAVLGLILQATPLYVVSLLVVLLTLGYYIIKKKGISFEGLPQENIELTNITNEMREVNKELRPALDALGLMDIEELEREMISIEGVQKTKRELQNEIETLYDDLNDLKEKMEEKLQELRALLYPYKSVEDDTEAVRIISTLGKAQCDHAALEASYTAALEDYTQAIGDENFDSITEEANELREKLNGVAPASAEDVDIESKIKECENELDKTQEELIKKETELALQNADPQELGKLNEEIKLLTGRIDRYDFEYSAITEAQSALNEAFESMQKDFGPMINFRAGKIVESLTGGQYSSVIISESLVPSVSDPNGSNIHSVSGLSGGTVDQVYLALRLAIAGILSEENLPILLDDAFAQYDDKRMIEALGYLAAENAADRIGQIILFTCHSRVTAAAEQLGIAEGITSF